MKKSGTQNSKPSPLYAILGTLYALYALDMLYAILDTLYALYAILDTGGDIQIQ